MARIPKKSEGVAPPKSDGVAPQSKNDEFELESISESASESENMSASENETESEVTCEITGEEAAEGAVNEVVNVSSKAGHIPGDYGLPVSKGKTPKKTVATKIASVSIKDGVKNDVKNDVKDAIKESEVVDDMVCKIPDEFYEVLVKEVATEFEQHDRYFGSAQEVSFFKRKSQEYMRNVVKRMKEYAENLNKTNDKAE